MEQEVWSDKKFMVIVEDSYDGVRVTLVDNATRRAARRIPTDYVEAHGRVSFVVSPPNFIQRALRITYQRKIDSKVSLAKSYAADHHKHAAKLQRRSIEGQAKRDKGLKELKKNYDTKEDSN